MKKLIIAIAIAASTNAMADADAVFKSDKGKIVIFDRTITTAVVGENNDLHFNFVAEYRPIGKGSVRVEMAGSCTAAGGHYGDIESDGSVPNQKIWVADGPTVVDKMMSHACVRSAEKALAKKAQPTKQTSTKIDI
jgi:hypothetical protein